MPGAESWEKLYKLEYLQLYEEGYSVGDKPKSDMNGIDLCNPGKYGEPRNDSGIPAKEWEKAYWELWKVRENGIKKGYHFVEPNDYVDIMLDAEAAPKLTPLSEQEYCDRLSGAWHGRCAAVTLGKPLERRMSRKDVQDYLMEVGAYPLNDWVPFRPEILEEFRKPSCKEYITSVTPDDDIHYTILALLLAEKHGLNYTKYDWLKNLTDNIPYNCLWSCTKQAFFHFINISEDRSAEEQINEFPTKMNPMREGINPVIRVDFWGYISPGDLRRASMLAYKDASVNAVKNGIYSSMFIAACISAALSKYPTVETILKAGKSVIPKKSRLAGTVNNVEKWYAESRDWIKVCDKIYENYGHLPFSGGLNNMAIIILSLLHGDLDFEKTITTAVMCGIDTDCTSGTAGSIVAAATGFERLDKKWVQPFSNLIKTNVAGFGEGRITDLVKRMYDVWEGIR